MTTNRLKPKTSFFALNQQFFSDEINEKYNILGKRLYTLLGLNSDDKIDEIRLKAGLEKLVEGLSSIDVNNIEITGEQVESVEGFAANFHRVLEEGKKDPKEFSECMTIVKALTLDFGALPRKSDEE